MQFLFFLRNKTCIFLFFYSNLLSIFDTYSILKSSSAKKSLVSVRFLIKIISQSRCGLFFFVVFFFVCHFSHHWLFAEFGVCVCVFSSLFLAHSYKYSQLEFRCAHFQHAGFFIRSLFILSFSLGNGKENMGSLFLPCLICLRFALSVCQHGNGFHLNSIGECMAIKCRFNFISHRKF